MRASSGSDPELLIYIDDSKLNLEVYPQIISKIYAMIRYKVYQKTKFKRNLPKNNLNESNLTKENSQEKSNNDS